ncbi:lipopolysaccharide heptosyltransferase I [Thiovulum sp. ES]|nr:lipopolysaccharide heptosyltransferase I [Thiovulum sp. ES]
MLVKTSQKILIVRLSALGDIIHSSAVLPFIKKAIPGIQIDWLVEVQFQQILENNPYIRHIHTVDLKQFKRNKNFINFQKVLLQLNKIRMEYKYDLIIDMQGLLKSSLISRYISNKVHGFSWNSAKEGFCSLFYNSTTKISYSENKIWRNFALVNDALNLDFKEEDILKKRPHLFCMNSFPKAKGQIIFVIGSSMDQKNYPKEKFLELARELDKPISIVWGNEKEFEIAEWIANKTGNAIVAPKLSLNQLKHYVLSSDLVIGNDTGPTHLAWAMNVPSIVLFGMTPIEQMIETNINKYLKSESEVDPEDLDKDDYSICDIEVGDVVKLALQLLEKEERNITH